MRIGVLLLLCVASMYCCCAEEVWVFLNDGRVGLSDLSGDPVSVMLPDGARSSVPGNAVKAHATHAEVDENVTEVLADFAHGTEVSKRGLQLQSLGASAVPRLLTALKSNVLVERAAGMYGLQFCWAPQAEAPAFAEFEKDRAVRAVALEALTRHVSEELIAERLQKYADDSDIATANLVFPTVDRYFPDASLKRVQRALADAKGRREALVRISHYLAPSVSAALLPLLDDKELATQRGAVVGLIAQLAGGDAIHERLLGFLKDERPAIREIAAEYFLWLGREGDSGALLAGLAQEKDVYVRAGLTAALTEIETRRGFKPDAEAELQKLLQNGDAIEPLFVYQAHEFAGKEDYVKRAKQLQEFIGSPCRGATGGEFRNAVGLPAAKEWIAPLRDYFDARRHSFGACVANPQSSFAGSVHIGDDVSWGNELRTIVAAAPGVVRLAEHVFSWGHIVIVEHKLPDGSAVCTLYAHLSPALSVKPGDIVASGQRIGCIGRSHSVDNGGYLAHLHFGVHRGPYTSTGAHWISGYVGTANWQAGQHEWVNPQEFLKEHGADGK
jgi:murein DD-endopeptidase MepM/ murein hydrolase activator NlpD